MGRKKLFENVTEIHIEIDQKDKEILKQFAKDEGLSLSAYLRRHGLMSIHEILYDMAKKQSKTPLEFLITTNIISKDGLIEFLITNDLISKEELVEFLKNILKNNQNEHSKT